MHPNSREAPLLAQPVTAATSRRPLLQPLVPRPRSAPTRAPCHTAPRPRTPQQPTENLGETAALGTTLQYLFLNRVSGGTLAAQAHGVSTDVLSDVVTTSFSFILCRTCFTICFQYQLGHSSHKTLFSAKHRFFQPTFKKKNFEEADSRKSFIYRHIYHFSTTQLSQK